MRKISTLFFALLFAVQYAAAQRNLYVVYKDGSMKQYSALSLSFGDNANKFSGSRVNVVANESSTDAEVYIDGHKFVDLGLPSGLLWAETNVGATSAADDGDYFAWGETSAKTSYSWDSYKFGSLSSGFSKYTGSDNKVALDKDDDAAYVNWGSSCRMPTLTEIEELASSTNCEWTWTSQTASNGTSVNGYLVTSVVNGNSIFLPASGCRYDEAISNYGTFGYYWSSTLRSSYVNNACELYFGEEDHGSNYDRRSYGQTVRPVADPSRTEATEHYMYIVKSDSTIETLPMSSIDYATFTLMEK